MLKFKNTLSVPYQCTVQYNNLLYLQGGPKVRTTAISVYSLITFFELINQIIVDFLNLIYFTCECKQKPE